MNHRSSRHPARHRKSPRVAPPAWAAGLLIAATATVFGACDAEEVVLTIKPVPPCGTGKDLKALCSETVFVDVAGDGIDVGTKSKGFVNPPFTVEEVPFGTNREVTIECTDAAQKRTARGVSGPFTLGAENPEVRVPMLSYAEFSQLPDLKSPGKCQEFPLGGEDFAKGGLYGFTSTVLNDGKVLVAGGLTKTGQTTQTTDKVFLFDPVTLSFEELANSGFSGRAFHTAIKLGTGEVLIAGGYQKTTSRQEVLGTALLYDPAAKKFAQTGKMAKHSVGGQNVQGRALHTATLMKAKDGDKFIESVVFIGGVYFSNGKMSAPSYLSDAEIYDPKEREFIAIEGGGASGALEAKMTQKRALHTATPYIDSRGRITRIFVIGGRSSDTVHATAEVFELDDGDYEKSGFNYTRLEGSGALKKARFGHEAVRLGNNSVILVGGFGKTNDFGLTFETIEDYHGAATDKIEYFDASLNEKTGAFEGIDGDAGCPTMSQARGFPAASKFNESDKVEIVMISGGVEDGHKSAGFMEVLRVDKDNPCGERTVKNASDSKAIKYEPRFLHNQVFVDSEDAKLLLLIGGITSEGKEFSLTSSTQVMGVNAD